MCGWGPYAREASVWEACCRYSGVINMFLNCPQKTDSWTVSAWASRANWPTFVVFHEQTHVLELPKKEKKRVVLLPKRAEE